MIFNFGCTDHEGFTQLTWFSKLVKISICICSSSSSSLWTWDQSFTHWRFNDCSSLFDRKYLWAPGTYLAPDKCFALFASGLKLEPTEISHPNTSVCRSIQSGFGAGCVALLCEPRASFLIVWTVYELNKCKIFSLHFLNQIFRDRWYYYRTSHQRNIPVGSTVKIRNSMRKSIFSWAPATDEPSLDNFQKSPRGKMS